MTIVLSYMQELKHSNNNKGTATYIITYIIICVCV